MKVNEQLGTVLRVGRRAGRRVARRVARRVRRDRERSGTATAAGSASGVLQPSFSKPKIKDADLATNVAWNRERWGQPAGWNTHDQFGYRWGGGVQQRASGIAKLADDHLRPFVQDRYDLRVVELSPGAGRFTVELIRYAASMTLVDLNQAAIDVCRERMRFYPTPITYHTNDGISLPMVGDGATDLLACYDSMVHMHPEVVRRYVNEAARVLDRGGIAWLDHSGRGQTDAGHRSAMTAELMAEFAADAGLGLLDQRWRNGWDCISVLEKRE